MAQEGTRGNLRRKILRGFVGVVLVWGYHTQSYYRTKRKRSEKAVRVNLTQEKKVPSYKKRKGRSARNCRIGHRMIKWKKTPGKEDSQGGKWGCKKAIRAWAIIEKGDSTRKNSRPKQKKMGLPLFGRRVSGGGKGGTIGSGERGADLQLKKGQQNGYFSRSFS